MKKLRNKSIEKEYTVEIIILLAIGVVAYLFLGNEWYHIDGDSEWYLGLYNGEGVMPLYQLFLYLIRILVGNDYILYAAPLFQSIIAMMCTMVFSIFVQRIFRLKLLELILIYLLCMAPFLIYLPDFGVTHNIMTEGVSYSLFYLFFVCILNAIYNRNLLSYVWLFVITQFMALTRSQLIITILFSGLVCSFMFLKNINNHFWHHKIKRIIGASGVFLLWMAIGLVSVFGIRKLYFEIVSDIKSGEVEQVATINHVSIDEKVIKRISLSGQFNTSLKIKSYYEANREDVNLFSEDYEKELFLMIYDALDEHEYLHDYARKDLYVWIDYTQDRIPIVEREVVNEYIAQHPGVVPNGNNTIGTKFAYTLLKKHWPQILKHSARIMLMSVVASVFFQIEPIYLLCHFIAIFLYLLLIVGTIIIKKMNDMIYKFSLSVLGFEIVLIVLTNLMLNGVQRYVVYGMGVFYIALYLIARELFMRYRNNDTNNN